MKADRTIQKLLRQQAALAAFGSFSFNEPDLQKILAEAGRVCAVSLDVPYTKICRYREEQNDLLVVAGHGWKDGVIGNVVSPADETSTQGRAYVTGKPVILEDIHKNNSYNLPGFYAEHDIVSTVDVLIKSAQGSFGVLEADWDSQYSFDQHDIDFLTGFANVIAEAAQTAERNAVLQVTLQEMQALIADKAILASELQHRVRNNLQLIYGMLIRQVEVADAAGKEGIRSIAKRVMSLSTIYDHLLTHHGLVDTIDFAAYLKSLCASLAAFQDKGAHTITLDCNADPMNLDLDTVTALGIVVAETTSNAYLHAFPDRDGVITVSLRSSDGNGGVLTIADNGTGFTERTGSKRHGVGLIRRLLQQVKGEAQLDSSNGTVWTLTFPLKPANARLAEAMPK